MTINALYIKMFHIMDKFHFQLKLQNILQIKHFLKPILRHYYGSKTLTEINGQTQMTLSFDQTGKIGNELWSNLVCTVLKYKFAKNLYKLHY